MLCAREVSLPYICLASSPQSPLSALIYPNRNLPIFYPSSISLSTVLLLVYYLLKSDYVLFQPWNSLELQTLRACLGLQCKTHCLAGFAAQLLESFPSMHRALHWIHQHFINQGSGTCLEFQHQKVEGETRTPRPSLVLQIVKGQPGIYRTLIRENNLKTSLAAQEKQNNL